MIAEAASALMVLGNNASLKEGVAVAAFPTLLHLLLSADAVYNERALGAIRNLVVKHPRNKQRLMAAPLGLRKAAAMLGPAYSTTSQQFAAGTIMALCIEEEYREAVMRLGVLSALGDLVQRSNKKASVQALASLWNLCFECPKNQTQVREVTIMQCDVGDAFRCCDATTHVIASLLSLHRTARLDCHNHPRARQHHAAPLCACCAGPAQYSHTAQCCAGDHAEHVR